VPYDFASFLASALAGAVGLVSSLALSDAGSLRYDAPEGCPSKTDFVRAVAARGADFGPGTGQRRFEVAIAPDREGYAGRFRVARHRDASSAREVHGSTCFEVMDGLAVITAIALQSSTPDESTSTALSSLPPPAVVEAEPSTASEKGASTRVPRVRDDRDAPGTLQLGPAFALTAFGGLSLGLVPSTPMPRYELSFTWAALEQRGNQGRLLGPVMRLALSLHGDVTYDTSSASTSLGAQSLTAGPCYAPIHDARGFALLTCLELTAGMIGASSVDRETKQKHMETFAFGSVGGALEAEYNLGRHFHLALRAGASALIAPIVVEASDGHELFRSSRYTAYATVGLGGHF
jgi:hypothetical protein